MHETTVVVAGMTFDVEYEFNPGTPDRYYMRNGDPGEPGEPAYAEIDTIRHKDVDVTTFTEEVFMEKYPGPPIPYNPKYIRLIDVITRMVEEAHEPEPDPEPPEEEFY